MKRDGLLPRMEARKWKSKTTYRYHPIDGKPINLGSDLQLAIRKVNDMTGREKDSGTIGKLWEQYQESNAWKILADTTKEEYKSCGKRILEVFSDMYASDIKPPMVYRYLTVAVPLNNGTANTVVLLPHYGFIHSCSAVAQIPPLYRKLLLI